MFAVSAVWLRVGQQIGRFWPSGDKPRRRAARGYGQLRGTIGSWLAETSRQSLKTHVDQSCLGRESEESESSGKGKIQSSSQQAKVAMPDTQRLGNLKP